MLLVTRAQPEADQWMLQLQAARIDARVLPLIEIKGVASRLPKPTWDAVMFVSRAAVTHFEHWQQLQAARYLATGQGTVQALLECGCDAQAIDAPHAASGQFDSEALWRAIAARDWTAKQVLMVRGSDAQEGAAAQKQGRMWLSEQLSHAGAQVTQMVVYQRQRPRWRGAQLQTWQAALAQPQAAIWLLSSSQAAWHLQQERLNRLENSPAKQAMPAINWGAFQAIASHARIAQAAQHLGLGQIHICRPVIADIVDTYHKIAL